MPRCERWTWVVLEEAARRSWHSRADGVGERWFLGSQNSNTKTLMPVWGFPGGGRGTWKQRNLQRAEIPTWSRRLQSVTQLRNNVRVANRGWGHPTLCLSVCWRLMRPCQGKGSPEH